MEEASSGRDGDHLGSVSPSASPQQSQSSTSVEEGEWLDSPGRKRKHEGPNHSDTVEDEQSTDSESWKRIHLSPKADQGRQGVNRGNSKRIRQDPNSGVDHIVVQGISCKEEEEEER
ncbi:hypothetical protein Pcinc_018794 [Petrolisthes cinctipes]|uniref:Uncharacterized protein n=1 Tax=Petrolisthes cinctipes TaxID=88211 RepID=A0AAE1FM54_PETCI|nr:hypothetical protein Pcinc_018794 [Petrolisthes cinctipes]